MTLINGNHIASVGVRLMDDQHGILMDVLNELQQAVVSGAQREHINEILDRLVGFTRMHFASEESLMEKINFPGLSVHQLEHQRWADQIVVESNKLRHGKVSNITHLLEFLRHGYMQHIEEHDQKYGRWLNEHGVQ